MSHLGWLDHDRVEALLELDLDTELSVADNELRVRKLLLQVEQVFEGRGSKPGHPVGPEDERLRREVPGVDSQLRGKDRLLGRVVRTKLFGVEQVWVKKHSIIRHS